MKTIEAASTARRNRLLGAARRKFGASRNDKFAAGFMADLFGRASVEDLEPYAPTEIAGFARSAAELLARRKPGRHVIRISNPDFGGRAKRHEAITLIEILNDNMPFLVDSVMSEMQDFGADILLVAHPVLTVTRNADGGLARYAGLDPAKADSKAIRESLITVHVNRLVGEEARADLAARLDAALAEVRRAVDGWLPMRARVERAVAEYKAAKTLLPAAETSEAIDFLEWLLDNNFTFLGIREYDFVGGAKRGELKRADIPGLGILERSQGARAQARQRGGHHDAGAPRIPDASGSADHHQGERQVARPPPRLHGLCRREDVRAGRTVARRVAHRRPVHLDRLHASRR